MIVKPLRAGEFVILNIVSLYLLTLLLLVGSKRYSVEI